jgi:hypothetical protein
MDLNISLNTQSDESLPPVTANTSIYSSLSMVQGESHIEVSPPIIPSGFTPPPNQEEAAIV